MKIHTAEDHEAIKLDDFEWSRLPRIADQVWPWGQVDELRNCTCGSTLYRTVVEGEPECFEVAS